MFKLIRDNEIRLRYFAMLLYIAMLYSIHCTNCFKNYFLSFFLFYFFFYFVYSVEKKLLSRVVNLAQFRRHVRINFMKHIQQEQVSIDFRKGQARIIREDNNEHHP